METSLHRQLKTLYATDEQEEIRLGRYRIDAIDEAGRLVEIQCAGLGAIRDKVRQLLKQHDVRVVKPVIRRRTLIKRQRKGGRVLSRRRSPSRGTILDVFDDLVHFVTVFPHPRLTLEPVLVDIEEHRLPPLRSRRTRRRYRVHDRTLEAVCSQVTLHAAADLALLLPGGLPPGEFTTLDLASCLNQPRWIAQRIAYCLRKTGAVQAVGKQRNAIVYAETPTQSARAA